MKKLEFNPKSVDRVLNVISNEFDYINYLYACKLLRKRDIRVNGNKITDNLLVNPTDVISVYIDETKKQAHYSIVYQDENIIIVNKKKGIEVENGLDLEIPNAIAVHRLDRNTEGLVLFAKNMAVKSELERIFKSNSLEKYYICEVVGAMPKNEDILKAYLLKDKDKSLVKIFQNRVPGSEEIKTGYKVLKKGNETSVLEVRLYTGKTHQIRAHLAYLGHAIIGDGKYGKNEDNKKFKEKTQKLICYKIVFRNKTGPLNYLNNRQYKIDVPFFDTDLI